MRLSPEDGRIEDPGPTATLAPSSFSRPSGRLITDSDGIWTNAELDFNAPGELGEPVSLPGERSLPVSTRTAALMEQIIEGTAPRTRALKSFEPQRLSPLHVNMILDRAAGLKPSEIAEKYDITTTRVGIILNHPDSTKLYVSLLSDTADGMSDPRKRIEGYAHEMLDLKVGLVRDPGQKAGLRNAIATDLLDRAGYGERKHIEIDTKHSIQMPANLAERLGAGLAAAASRREIPYTSFVQDGTQVLTPSGIAAQVPVLLDSEAAPLGLPSGTGHPETTAGTSLSTYPVAAPQPSTQERVA
jgi:hypothetical protein